MSHKMNPGTMCRGSCMRVAFGVSVAIVLRVSIVTLEENT